MADYKPNEMMTIAAARALRNEDVCFVGIGQPSAACQSRASVARAGYHAHLRIRHARHQADGLPLSIGDGELCETALTTVSVPEMFRYWLQGGRISVGFLGGAQIDKFANLNTTVVGPYASRRCGCPAAAVRRKSQLSCGEIFIIMKQGKRSFVDKIDFFTSIGHVSGGDSRAKAWHQDKGSDAAGDRSGGLRARS